MRVRREKRDRMLASGVQPYPVAVPRTHSLAQVRADHPDLEPGQETDDVVGVAGRVVFVRNTGKLCFATLQEGDGTRLQVMLSLAEVGEAALAQWKADVDLGDHVFVHGRVVSSKRGELSVMADGWQLAAKALRPLPNLHEGAELGEDTRVRQRYVDLIVRPEARAMARRRATVVRSLRETFHHHDYVEIETPMLQTLHGGAAARPFSTHINAFDMDVFLRIAPELFLKRAAVGGLERVFEINRNFRNEGADSTHSPEFAMLEFYEAYGDYNSVADMTRVLVQNACEAIFGSHVATLVDGSAYDFGGEWACLTMYGSLSEALGEQVTPDTTVAQLVAHAERLGLEVDPAHRGHGKLVEKLWEHLIGDDLHGPTFVRDFPVETTPLTREHRTQPGVTEKWDLYVRGFELATGYSELVDPVVQRERFEAQAKLAALGDEEAMRLDEDFLRAMEYALPPTGGQGMGIDRLLMALTGIGSIRETILFPLVKPL
ncbi:MAG TPA: lysine--tRNA ligase [Actinomycetales bacterium]|nr:lysine--tRNA ligase [Actinomycetales bacterium]